MILQPGLLPGAREVFLDTISYSEGPLAEDMLPQVACPVMIAWGDQDRWEPITKGRAYADFPCVVEFVELKGVGHCGQDEAPHLVNPLIKRFVEACEAGQYGKAPSAPTQAA
jgi:pimeloyl-ACP methyl ester carboxylesterase